MVRPPVRFSTAAVAHLAILLGGAIFGFFYAWTCSTMWGLDRADPRVSITAMQQMNASVRNALFFPAFFLTPLAMAAAGYLARRDGATRASRAFAAGAGLYLLGGLLLTMAINVPMNDQLSSMPAPQSIDEARAVWKAYSTRWQFFNQLRTAASGLALVAATFGLWALARHARQLPEP